MSRKFLTGALIALVIVSCNNESIEEEYNITPNIPTRSSSSLEWDECEKCVISTGDTINLPWANTTISTIPTEIRKDVQKSNGWRILYSNVRIIGCNMNFDQQSGANYLILYNKYTGVLKGYYYTSSVQQNNHANWLLTKAHGDKAHGDGSGEHFYK